MIVDRHVHELAVEETDHQAGAAGHGGMHGVAAHPVAEQRVLGVGGTAADLIARIEVAHDHLDPAGFEVRVDGVAQELADVAQLARLPDASFSAAVFQAAPGRRPRPRR